MGSTELMVANDLRLQSMRPRNPLNKPVTPPRLSDPLPLPPPPGRYQLPEAPQVVVHPHRSAKSGKFDCTVMSLSVLLDYRPEDNKVGAAGCRGGEAWGTSAVQTGKGF